MSTFRQILMGLLLVTGLVAQQRTVDITLKDGRVLHGKIISRTQERLILSDGTLEFAVPSSSIASITDVKRTPAPAPKTGSGQQQDPPVEQPATPAAQDPPQEPPAVPAGQDPPQEPPPAPAVETAPAPAPKVARPEPALRISVTGTKTDSTPGERFQSRLGWIAERYSWAVPQAGSEAMSMALLFLIIFTFSIHFGGLFANLQDRSLTRSFTASLFIVIALAAQCAFLPSSPPVIAGAILADLFGWFVMVRVVLAGGFFNGFSLMFAVGVLGVLAGILLEIVDYVFVTIDHAH